MNEIHFGCTHTRAPRRTWCLAARGCGLRPRTSRAAHTSWRRRSAWTQPKWSGDARIERVPLLFGRGSIGQYRRSSCGNLLKSKPRRGAEALARDKQKGPDPCGVRASEEQSSKGVPLGAALSRWIHVVAALKPLMPHGPCGAGACGRDSTRHGSVRFGVAHRCHDESLKIKTVGPFGRRSAL